MSERTARKSCPRRRGGGGLLWVTSQAEDAGAPLARARPPCAGILKGDRSAGRAGRAGPMASTSSHLVSPGFAGHGAAAGRDCWRCAGGGGRSRPGRRGRPVRGWPAVPYAPPGGGVAVGLRGRPRRPLGQGGRRGKALPSVGPASALLLLPVLVPPPGSPRAWRGRAPLPPRAPAGP